MIFHNQDQNPACGKPQQQNVQNRGQLHEAECFLSDEYRQTDGYPRRQIPEGKIDKDTKYPGSYNFWLGDNKRQKAHLPDIPVKAVFVGPKRRAAHKIAIDAAVAAGVNKLVYTSIVGAGHEDINAYEVNDHVWTERYIKKQPIHYLILRDSQYAEAMVSTFVEAVENTNGIIRNNMGDGKMAFVSRDDCALAAACAAMSDWEDRIVDINGAELLTIAQYMAIASEVTGKKTEYQYINDDEMYEFFDSIGVPRTTEEMWADTAKNFPFCSDGMVSFGRAIRLNQMSTFTDDFEKLTGQKPITVREMFEDMENHLIGTRTSTDN